MTLPAPQHSKREQALSALFRCLQRLAAGPDGLKVERNEPLPQKLARGGMLILHDGDPGDPEIGLSPLSYAWEHKAEIDVLVPGTTTADRDAALDALLARLAQALADDTTLGGVVDYCGVVEAPRITILPVEGSTPWKGAEVTVTLAYTSPTPLS